MSETTIMRFAERLDAYVRLHKISEFSVTFHGGEPLLFGAPRLVYATQQIRSSVVSSCRIEFSLQTNGTLLTDADIEKLEQAEISISLSLDGPRRANDLHRLDHSGKSTFEPVIAGIEKLKKRKSGIFRGVIAVIDPCIRPRELLDFFGTLSLPRLDLLLPDATHLHPPIGRTEQNNLYVDWVKDAFELWFREYSHIPIRWFDAILASRCGIPSSTDAMGFGSVSLIVIDTDGSYSDHDVFKITKPGAASLHRTLDEISFEDAARHASIEEHGLRLTIEGVAEECKACPVIDACGSGSVMHRWHPVRGLNAPTVYCAEIFHLMQTANRLLQESLNISQPEKQNLNVSDFTSGETLLNECRRWRAETEARADEIALAGGFDRRSTSAAAILLRANAGASTTTFNPNSKAGLWLQTVTIQSTEPWLVSPFLDTIRVYSKDAEQVQHGIKLLGEVESCIRAFDPALLLCIKNLITDIIFVESKLESEDNIFSFSDDSAPNVLYIAPFAGSVRLEPDDIADSILHEFFHHVLYHMERDGPMLLDKVYPRFPAPWRSGLRPSGGFLHGTFVFSGLSKYWGALAKANLAFTDSLKAKSNAIRFRENAIYGIGSLQNFALLTPRGRDFLAKLANNITAFEIKVLPPGILF